MLAFSESTSILGSEKNISNESYKDQNLYEFIGLNIHSEIVKNYLNNLGSYKYWEIGDYTKDYHYENDGIQFRTDENDIIEVIFCFSKDNRYINKPVNFVGKLPFELTFEDTMEEIHSKIGEGVLYRSHGFYGRIYYWFIQDSLNLYIELELPRTNDKEILIEQISLTKSR